MRGCVPPVLLKAFRVNEPFPATCTFTLSPGEEEVFFAVLRDLGLAARVHRKGYIAVEVLPIAACTPQENKRLQAADHLYKSIFGCLCYYGAMESKQLGALLLPNLENPASFLLHIWSKRIGLEGFVNTGDKGCWLVSPRLDNPEKLISLLGTSGMDSLPLEHFTDRDFEYAATFGLAFPVSGPYGRVMRWLSTFHVDLSDADDLLQDAIIAAQNGSTEVYYALMTQPAGERIPNMYLNALRELHNQIPQWVYKGHSLADINQRLEPEKKRVSPGALCPCGSGKRYRACCGRFQ